MPPAWCQQDLVLGGDVCCCRDPLLQSIDRVEADGISVQALARMRYSNLKRHPGRRPVAPVFAEAIFERREEARDDEREC